MTWWRSVFERYCVGGDVHFRFVGGYFDDMGFVREVVVEVVVIVFVWVVEVGGYLLVVVGVGDLEWLHGFVFSR